MAVFGYADEKQIWLADQATDSVVLILGAMSH